MSRDLWMTPSFKCCAIYWLKGGNQLQLLFPPPFSCNCVDCRSIFCQLNHRLLCNLSELINLNTGRWTCLESFLLFIDSLSQVVYVVYVVSAFLGHHHNKPLWYSRPLPSSNNLLRMMFGWCWSWSCWTTVMVDDWIKSWTWSL